MFRCLFLALVLFFVGLPAEAGREGVVESPVQGGSLYGDAEMGAAPIPEPGAFLIFGIGLTLLAFSDLRGGTERG